MTLAPAGSQTGVAALLTRATDLYADDDEAVAILRGYSERLDEPLRLAIGGMVKAGKSTLLNAIVGDRIAPTDAGECTTIVTWYRYGDTPRIRLHRRDGTSRAIPIRRADGMLDIRLDGEDPDAIDKIVVHWPASSLRNLTIIDTPGIASLSTDVSARSARFLLPEKAVSEADALLYLVRQMHATDLDFLRSFHEQADASASTVSTLAVLSRADEIGGGRLDSLLSARGVAERYRRDDNLGGFALGILPLAGLLAQTARTLRQAEFEALAVLAGLARKDRERMLVSVDRFAAADLPGVPTEARAGLLDRFGLFGIRLASVLLRDGEGDSSFLAAELARRSGLEELLKTIDDVLRSRATALKARSALTGLSLLLEQKPKGGSVALGAEIERIRASAHPLRELTVLTRSRTTGLPIPNGLRSEAERLLGGRGVAAWQRLGLPAESESDVVLEKAVDTLRRWKTLRESPLIARDSARTCDVVIRSCEAIILETRVDHPAWSGVGSTSTLSSSGRNHPRALGSSATMTAAPASSS